MVQQDNLDGTLARLIPYYTEPGALLKAVRKEHPDVSKKKIILSAFSVMIDLAEKDPAAAKMLHDLALNNRSAM